MDFAFSCPRLLPGHWILKIHEKKEQIYITPELF